MKSLTNVSKPNGLDIFIKNVAKRLGMNRSALSEDEINIIKKEYKSNNKNVENVANIIKTNKKAKVEIASTKKNKFN